MARYDHLPIFQSAYKLTLEIYKTTGLFPREHKFGLGQKLKEISDDLLSFIIYANSKKEKKDTLENARMSLEQLRIHMRFACDLKIIGAKRYEFFNLKIEEISKQLSGWFDWCLKDIKTLDQKDL